MTFEGIPSAGDISTLRWSIAPNFWRYDRQNNLLYLPDGTVASYDEQGRLASFRDQFDNQVALTYGTGTLEVLQAVGNQSRLVTLTMDDATQLPLTMTYEDRTWTYHYEAGADHRWLTDVVLPVGPGWHFEYVASQDSFTNRKVSKVVTPQGGTIEYTYGLEPFIAIHSILGTPQNKTVYVLKTRTTGGPSVNPGTWTFNYSIGANKAADAVTIITPTGKVYHGYEPMDDVAAGGWLLATVVLQTPTGTEVQKEVRQYTPLLGPGGNIPVLAKSIITRDGREYETESKYEFCTPGPFGTCSPPVEDPQCPPGKFANFHQPRKIFEREAGELRRSTIRCYRLFEETTAYLGAQPVSETVTVGGETVTTSRIYDNLGFRTSETSNGLTATFAADDDGNVASTTVGSGAEATTTSFTYKYGQVATITTAGHTTVRDINHDGTLLWEERAQGPAVRRNNFLFDKLMRPVSVAAPAVTPTTTTYPAVESPRIITIQRAAETTQTFLDGFGRTIRTESSSASGQVVKVRFEYDPEGRQSFLSDPYVAGNGDAGIRLSFDPLGRVKSLEHTTESDSPRVYEYGRATVTVTDEEGNRTVSSHQSFGHPDDHRMTTLVDAAGTSWSYAYNALGAMTTMSGGDVTRTWTYDANKLLASETHPESGTVTYTYDTAGRLKTRKDATAQAAGSTGLSFTYDGNGRATDVHANGVLIRHVEYEPGLSDNPVFVQSPVEGVTTTFTYENATGRLRTRTDTVDGHAPFTVTYDYDPKGNVSRVTYPSGRQVNYRYRSLDNSLWEIINSNNQYYAKAFTYAPSGAPTGYRLGDGNHVSLAYDERLRVKAITATPLSLHYTYDKVGNVRTLQSPQAGDQVFTYDQLGRLKTATGPYDPIAYDYDAHGNRQSNATGTYTYDPQNVFRLRSYPGAPGDMVYDVGGRLSQRGGQTFVYTPTNQLRQINEDNAPAAQFLYDGADWRIKKVADGFTTYSIRGLNGQLFHEKIINNSTGDTEMRDYIYAGSRLLAVVKGAP